MAEVKLLYFCDEWKNYGSMQLQGVFNNDEALCSAIEESVKKGDIEIDCGNECEHCDQCLLNDLSQMSIQWINNNFRYLYVDVLNLNELR